MADDSEELVNTSFTAPRWLAERLSEVAKGNRRSRSQQVVVILEEWLRANDAEWWRKHRSGDRR